MTSPEQHGVSRRGLLRAASRRPRPIWQTLDVLGGGAGDVLWGVWADGPNHALVVGDEGTILRYDGVAWHREDSGTKLPLHAVLGFGRDFAVAVGWMGVITIYDGHRWRLVQGGVVDEATRQFAHGRRNRPLFGLWGDGPENLLAVGDHGRVCCFDGTGWQEIETGVDDHLRSLIGLADGTLIACGAQGVILHHDGAHWAAIESGTRAHLSGIHARRPDEIYAVGGQYDRGANSFVGVLLRYDGRSWRIIPSTAPLPRLRAIANAGEDLLVVADQGRIFRLAEGRIDEERSGVGYDLFALAACDDRRVLAVGDFGTILARAESDVAAECGVGERQPAAVVAAPRWQVMPQDSTDRVLWSVWGSGSSDVFAVGENGTAIHHDGSRWQRMPTPTDLHLHGLWGRAHDDVYAVGQLGLILHFDGQTWREVHRLNVDLTAVAIAGFAPHDIFVVGDEGLILRYDGVGWERVPSGTKNALYGIWGLDADHVLAVGDFGMVLRWNGSAWEAFEAGTESFLYGVWGAGLDDIFVCGLAGTIAHFDGRRWTTQATRRRVDLLAMAGNTASAPLVVGSQGTALRHDRGRWLAEETGTDGSLRALWVGPDGTAFAVGDRGTVIRRPASP